MSEPLKGGFGSFGSATSPFSLGGTNNANAGNAPVSNTTSLFGSTGAAGSTTAAPSNTGTPGGLFGNTGAKPGGLFGGSAPSGGLFGNFGGSSTPGASTTATSTTAAPAASGGFFGTKPTTPTAAPATTAFTLGAGTSSPSGGLFGNLSKPAENPGTNASAAPGSAAGGSLFGGGNLFKPTPPAPSAAPSAPATSTAPATPSLFSGGNLFGQKKDEPPKAASPAPTAPASTGGLFGSFGPAPANGAPSKDAAPAVSSPSPFGNLFGAPKPAATAEQKPDAAKEGEKESSAPALPTFSLGSTASLGAKPDASKGTTPAPPSGAVAPTSATTAAISVPPPSMLRGKTIEEIVNKWSADLETHVREFNRLAGEVSVWDRALIDNGNTLSALFQHVLLAEREQNDVEQSLSHVEQQQKELASTLDVYEKAAKDIFDGQGGSLRALDVGPADAERDKNYTLAAELNTQLDDLSRSLTQMIESVNTLTEPAQNGDGSSSTDLVAPGGPAAGSAAKGEDALQQIGAILSTHLESLQWIDGAVREVEGKVNDVEKRLRDTNIGSPGGNNAGYSSTNARPRGFGLR